MTSACTWKTPRRARGSKPTGSPSTSVSSSWRSVIEKCMVFACGCTECFVSLQDVDAATDMVLDRSFQKPKPKVVNAPPPAPVPRSRRDSAREPWQTQYDDIDDSEAMAPAAVDSEEEEMNLATLLNILDGSTYLLYCILPDKTMISLAFTITDASVCSYRCGKPRSHTDHDLQLPRTAGQGFGEKRSRRFIPGIQEGHVGHHQRDVSLVSSASVSRPSYCTLPPRCRPIHASSLILWASETWQTIRPRTCRPRYRSRCISWCTSSCHLFTA